MAQTALNSIIDRHLWRIIHCCLFAAIISVLVSCVGGQQSIVSDAQAQADRSTFDCTVVKEIPLAECQALIALYTATNGAHWAPEYEWLRADRPCAWQGVSCGRRFLRVFFIRSKHVTQLELPHAHMQGQVPSDIGLFTHLTRLDLGSNELTALPAEIGQLSMLETLEVDNNKLTQLPPEMGQLSNLIDIDLDHNELTEVPPDFGQLTKLKRLDLRGNPPVKLPPELDQLPNLEILIE
jgi:Leucine-rich repeat (LRR) protein